MTQLGIDRVEMRSQPCHFESSSRWVRVIGRDSPGPRSESQRPRQHPGGGEVRPVPTHKGSLACLSERRDAPPAATDTVGSHVLGRDLGTFPDVGQGALGEVDALLQLGQPSLELA